MKTTLLRVVAPACVAIALLFAGSNRASAAYLSIQVGGPPPPLVVEHRWAPPYRGAVWIAGHHEWIHGHWVWIAGYYAYPPHRGAVWVSGRYRHGYWYPGHWA